LDFHTAYLGLGSNLGDRTGYLKEAVRLLRDDRSCAVVRASSLYETKAVGLEDQPDFLNAVIEIRTSLDPRALLARCLEVERKIGRKRTIPWGPRVIDVDILVYESVSVNDADLVIPHSRLYERAFALAPLTEIAPDANIGDGLTAAEALERVRDQGTRIVQNRSWAD
jgi:2-amino-4-hydroxy-6-hydroxymethyldihydropteridine diphosphokinase